jgi:hypothetical protein
MTVITDEFMREMLTKTKSYVVCILKAGPNFDGAQAKEIIWEHGRRNFELRRDGILPIVCPVSDASDVVGLGIFNVDIDETRKIMEGDPGVTEGVFVYELYTGRSFPGDSLPD